MNRPKALSRKMKDYYFKQDAYGKFDIYETIRPFPVFVGFYSEKEAKDYVCFYCKEGYKCNPCTANGWVDYSHTP